MSARERDGIEPIRTTRSKSAHSRIVIVTTSFPADETDPAGHFVRAHVRELERDGHEVVVVAPAVGGAFGWPGVGARLRERPWRVVDAARFVLASQRRLTALDTDRVVAHWAVPSAWPIAGAGQTPVEVISHGGDVRLIVSLPATARHFVVDAIVRRAETWAFVSERLLDQLLSALDRERRSRVSRIARIWVPPIEWPNVGAAIAARRRDLAGARVAVCVARLVTPKRVDRVIEYVAGASERYRLIVVGDGPERARLEAQAKALCVDARFVGVVGRPDALAWIGAADVLLHASEAEGLSTVVREAHFLGTTVVTLASEGEASRPTGKR